MAASLGYPYRQGHRGNQPLAVPHLSDTAMVMIVLSNGMGNP
jgi:hypothetical protein